MNSFKIKIYKKCLTYMYTCVYKCKKRAKRHKRVPSNSSVEVDFVSPSSFPSCLFQ